MIRTILVMTFVVVFLILSLPIWLIELVIGLFSQEAKEKSSLAIIRFAFKIVIFLAGTKVIVAGEENIPTDHAVLFVGNHRSYFDIVLGYILVKGLCGFVSKKENDKLPIFRLWMRNLHCVFLDRNNIKEGYKTILQAIEKVKSGISMFIFPEGTRNKVPGTFMPFHDGSFKIAEKGNVPVVPVTFVETGDIFEDHVPFVKKRAVVVDFGQEVFLKGLDLQGKKSVGNYFRDLIMETYDRDKKEYLS